MFPRLLLLSFAWVASLSAQTPVPHATPGTPVRTVLRAQPLGGNEDSEPVSPAAGATPPEAARAPSPLNVKPTGEEDAVKLQIFLDQSLFGPGVIDGRPGRFTELAVQSWNEVNGFPLGDWVGVNTAARKAVGHAFAVAVVPDVTTQWVDETLPEKKAEQAKRKRMSYRSIGEFMAERYHTSTEYLIKINGASKIRNLRPKDSLLVPNVSPFQIEKVTGAGYKSDPHLSARHAVVDTKINQVRIFEGSPAALIVSEDGAAAPRANRGLIASFPITPGKDKFIKFGTWALANMIELPWWRYDQQLLDTGVRGSESLNIPPGPNSPVGIIWNGTTRPGIGMHGTSDPETIGRARSSGCIRLANWDAIRLPTLLRPGASVEIR
ncbi:MAG: L,D-transpeptidase [Luteolibacter sp.]